MVQDDFYTFIPNSNIISEKPNKHIFFEFKTKNEAENFVKYLQTKFSRFCLSILKNNSQLDRGELKSVPWLDFTQEWNDIKLRKYFNITDKEWKFIDSVIPEYYNKETKITKSVGVQINKESYDFKVGEVYEYIGKSKKIQSKKVTLIKELKNTFKIKDSKKNIVDIAKTTLKLNN